MEEVLQGIEGALNHEQYYAALFMAVTIPDICAALGSGNGQTSGDKYRDWYDKNVPEKNGFKGVDAYRFRCRLLHQGTADNTGTMQGPAGSFTKYIFTIPSPNNNIADGNRINDQINLDLVTFCNSLIKSSKSWLEQNRTSTIVQGNLTKMVRTYENPLAPAISMPGLKAIA